MSIVGKKLSEEKEHAKWFTGFEKNIPNFTGRKDPSPYPSPPDDFTVISLGLAGRDLMALSNCSKDKVSDMLKYYI